VNGWRNLRLSIRALTRSRLRTLMSASSMTIGIAAVVLLFGVGEGAERAFQQTLEEMGKNLLAVGARRGESTALRGGGARYLDSLTLDDWRALNEELESVARAAPIAMNNFDLRFAGQFRNATVIGTTPEFQLTNNFKVVAGRFIDQSDIEDHSRVAVIGAQVATELFLGEQPLGERLLVGNSPFIIVGILEEKGVDQTGTPQDDRILVPVTTALRRLLNVDGVDRIFVQAISKDSLELATQQVRTLLRRRHNLDGTAAEDDFTIDNQAGLLATLDETDQALARFLSGIAVLALGLASMGLLAVTQLAVRERHGEIGLRLAVGALPRQILAQFLAEAVMIALLGALAGLLVGALGIILGEWLLGWQLALGWEGLLYPFLVALFLSLLFGAYPALRAARLDPIVALRSV
jgi:putative ABC transport system permease protein